jgi:hypothetical protein
MRKNLVFGFLALGAFLCGMTGKYVQALALADPCIPINISQTDITVSSSSGYDTYLSDGWGTLPGTYMPCGGTQKKMRWKGNTAFWFDCQDTGGSTHCQLCLYAEMHDGYGTPYYSAAMQPWDSESPLCKTTKNITSINPAVLPPNGDCCSTLSGGAYEMTLGAAPRNFGLTNDCATNGQFMWIYKTYTTIAPSC